MLVQREVFDVLCEDHVNAPVSALVEMVEATARGSAKKTAAKKTGGQRGKAKHPPPAARGRRGPAVLGSRPSTTQ